MLTSHCLQDKYRVKKQKKYAPRVLLRRPFARRYTPVFKSPLVILEIDVLLPDFSFIYNLIFGEGEGRTRLDNVFTAFL